MAGENNVKCYAVFLQILLLLGKSEESRPMVFRLLSIGFKEYFVNNFDIVLGRQLMSRIKPAQKCSTFNDEQKD